MSFSFLVHEQCKNTPDRLEAWAKAVVELQVVLAFADGSLSRSERMAISLLSVGDPDHARPIIPLVQSIKKHGFPQASDRVLREIHELLEGETPAARQEIATTIARESIATMVADDVITDGERRFVLEQLGPQLGLPEEQSREFVQTASDQLARHKNYAERGLEVYLLLAALGDRPPQLSRAGGDALPGFLGAVDTFVEKHRVGSARVMAYFLAVLRGVHWVYHYEEHLSALGQLVATARDIERRVGAEVRLEDIRQELDQIRKRGDDRFAYRCVARHVLNALERLDGLNEAQQKLLQNGIVPALEIGPELVRPWITQKPASSDKSGETTGSVSRSVDRSDNEKSMSRWRFWK